MSSISYIWRQTRHLLSHGKFTTALLLLASAPSLAADQWHFTDVGRVVAVSDIHGAYEAFVATLNNAAVLDEDLKWVGGSTHLVITGDLVDRGPDSRAVMDLLMRLETEASAEGGRVHVLIGNHEVMNINGDLRYVSKAEYAAFANQESAAERDRWFSAYRSLRAPAGADAESVRAEFEKKFAPGFFAHRRAFAADGEYGRWLLSKPVIVVINGTAFVHGGLSPMVAEIGLQGVNDTLVAELRTYVERLQLLIDEQLLLPTDSAYDHARLLQDLLPHTTMTASVAAAAADIMRLSDSKLDASDGPLWYRGHTFCNALIEGDRLDAALAAIGANRVVIGHTPTENLQVLERFGGRLYEIDTGMLQSYYGGRGHALIIEGDRVFVLGQDGGEARSPLPHPRQVGTRPGAAMTEDAIELLLLRGDIIGDVTESSGRRIMTVSDGQHSINAEFRRQSRRGVYPEVAAYQLDRLLGFDMVPATVARVVDGAPGSLQFMPVRWVDENQRQANGSGAGAYCPLAAQWGATLVFDVLAGNEHRNAEALRYSLDGWQLMLTDHEKAFSTSRSLPKRLRETRLAVGPAWKTALRGLTDEVLQRRFATVLDERRIEALAARRDLLLSQ